MQGGPGDLERSSAAARESLKRGTTFKFVPRRDVEAIDAEFHAAGLTPTRPYTRLTDERECRCDRCGTRRFVRLRTLRAERGYPCRWCHGWDHWQPWSVRVRARTAQWRAIRGPDFVIEQLAREQLAPLTPIGDEFTPVGVLCMVCGETLVTVPERMSANRPGWSSCQRCSLDRSRKVRADAPDLFAANGLELLGPCHGEYVPQAARCTTCGSERRISYNDLRHGTAPLCWTCTHGIRVDEPHRVYLIRFPRLGVWKIGLTHNRHDRRLGQHELEGGIVDSTILVPDRAAARQVESYVKALCYEWRRPGIGPEHFPQGGWTETWSIEGPRVDLPSVLVAAGVTQAAHVSEGEG